MKCPAVQIQNFALFLKNFKNSGVAVSLVDCGVSGNKIEEFTVIDIVEVDSFSPVDYDWVWLVVVAAVF
jgi:hypothetical protein